MMRCLCCSSSCLLQSLLRLSRSLLLLLLLCLNKLRHLLVVEVLKLLVRDLSHLLVSLQQQVVGGGHVVVLVCIYASHCLVLPEVVLHQQVKYLSVYGDLTKADEDSTCDFLYSNLVKPGVFANVPNLKSFLRVSVQDSLDQISRLS